MFPYRFVISNFEEQLKINSSKPPRNLCHCALIESTAHIVFNVFHSFLTHGSLTLKILQQQTFKVKQIMEDRKCNINIDMTHA